MKSLTEHLNEYIGQGSVNEAFGSHDFPKVVKAKVEYIVEPKLDKYGAAGNADCFTIPDNQPCLPCTAKGKDNTYIAYIISQNGKLYAQCIKSSMSIPSLGYEGRMTIMQGKKKVLMNMPQNLYARVFSERPMVGCEVTFTLVEETDDYGRYEIKMEYPYWYDFNAFVGLYSKFVFGRDLQKALSGLPFKAPYKTPYDIWCNYCIPIILMWKANGKLQDELLDREQNNLPVDANEVTDTLYKMGYNLDKKSTETIAQYLGSTVGIVRRQFGL